MKLDFRMNLVCITILMSCTSIAAQTQPARPHIVGIGQVEFYSTDLEAAGTFYRTIFGSEGKSDTCAWSNISQVAGNFNFSSLCSGQHLRLKEAPKPPSSALLAEVVFATDDVKAMKKYLEAKTIIKASGEQYFAVMDPEGHRIGFMPSSPSSTPPSSDGMHIIHAGFVVHDRDAEDKFYKDILGFHVYWHGGMKDGEDNWVDMQVPDGTDWIEYMLRVSPDASHKTLGVMNHIALGVPDIQAAKEQLIKNGWKGTEEPKIGRDGKWQLNLYDPDETRVELMEFKPTKEPCCSAYTGPHPHP
jgi:catechol 2,3-dioxygenase-like lactoylglutathione lyase family enzyme